MHRSGISGDIRRIRRPRPQRGVLPLPADMPGRVHQPAAAPTRPRSSSRQKVWEIAQYPLIALVSLAAAANATVGQFIILGYALVVLIRRQPSQLSFGLALVLLVTVPLFQAIGQPSIAENAAIYVYELLVVGTIGAILELKQKA